MKLSCVEQGYRNRRIIYNLLKQENKPINVKSISQVINLSAGSIHIHCRNLIRFGLVEELKIKIYDEQNYRWQNIIHYQIKNH